jgi:hypothetical protein
VNAREQRLLGALKELARMDRRTFDRLVPSKGRAGVEVVRRIAERAHAYFELPPADRQNEGLSDDAFAADGAGASSSERRTIERGFQNLNEALSNLGASVRITRPARRPAEAVDAADAWSGERPSPFRQRLEPETFTRIERGAIDQALRAFLLPAPRALTLAAVVAPAGFGKTTALGQIAASAGSLGVLWMSAAFCEDFAAGTAPADFLTTALLGAPAEPDELRSSVALHPGGLLVVDTVDLVLDEDSAREWASAFRAVAAAGVRVILSCRSWEWRHVLSPHLRDATMILVPPFSREEALRAVSGYCEANGVPPETLLARVSELMTEDRRLERIVRNPLLLSLICQLFGPSGSVPKDLTVLRLYEELVDRRVRRTRRGGGPSDPLARAKERLCYQFAREVVARTDLHVQEVLSRETLGEVDEAAFAELRSDGIIEELAGLRLRLFHQTFLEYVVGAWLTTEPAIAKAFLARIAGASSVPYSAAALLRMYLAQIPGDEERHAAARTLPLRQLPVFHAVALAWAAHGTPTELLRELAERARVTGAGFEEAVVDAVDSFAGAWSEELTEVVLGMTEQYQPPVVRTLIPVVLQVAGTLSDPARERFVRLLKERSQPEIDLLTMFAAELGRRTDAVSARWLVELGDEFVALGPTGQRAVLNAVTRTADPAPRARLFARIRTRKVDHTWHEEATKLIVALVDDGVFARDGSDDAGDQNLRTSPLPGDWALHGYRALGRYLADHQTHDAVRRYVHGVAFGPKGMIGGTLVILAEAVSSGLPTATLRAALADITSPSPDRSKALAEVAFIAAGDRHPAPRESPNGHGVAARRYAAPATRPESLRALAEQATSPKSSLALQAAKTLADAAKVGVYDVSLLQQMLEARVPGVRVAAYRTLQLLLEHDLLDETVRAGVGGAVANAALAETTTASFVAALDVLITILLRDGPPKGSVALLRSLFRALEQPWIDGGCVLRVAHLAEILVTRTPEAERAAFWPAIAPQFVSFNLCSYRSVEKHLVPTLRYLLAVSERAISDVVLSADASVPYENLRALYLAIQIARPDSSLIAALVEKEGRLKTVRPHRG